MATDLQMLLTTKPATEKGRRLAEDDVDAIDSFHILEGVAPLCVWLDSILTLLSGKCSGVSPAYCTTRPLHLHRPPKSAPSVRSPLREAIPDPVERVVRYTRARKLLNAEMSYSDATSMSECLPRATNADPSNILYISLMRSAPCRPFCFGVCSVAGDAGSMSVRLLSTSSPEIESTVDRDLDPLPGSTLILALFF